MTVAPTFARLRESLAGAGDPVVLFNKSHSGSRVLAELVAAGGVFLGAERTESGDALPIWEWVEALVLGHYPGFAGLWDGSRPPEASIAALGERAFARHLAGRASGRPWGWKLCETVYALPVIDHCFPRARYVHLVRDGRDVAFADHHGPTDAFWRKVYFDTDRIRTFRGRALTGLGYRLEPHVHNALHWMSSVRLGRAAGAMLRERCLEVRYEDLCLDFERTARRVLEFVGAPSVDAAIAALSPRISSAAVGRHRREPRRKVRAVVEIEKPLLLSLGYLDVDPEPPAWTDRARAAAHALAVRLRRRPASPPRAVPR